MANVNLYRVSVPEGGYSKVSWIECEGYFGPTQYLQNSFKSIDFQAQNNSVSASASATIAVIGYCNDDCTGCYLIGETTTTSTTIPPVNFTLTPTCEGSGINGTGKITVNGFSGGNGTYSSIAIGSSAGAALSATPISLGGATSYNFTGVFNGTWFIILRDSSGASTTKSTSVNCTNTTTTTSTSTTSTTTSTTSTTSTTTAAIDCTYNGGTAVMVYETTTTTSTSTSTTVAPTSTTTTSTTTTTTAAPTCNSWALYTNGNSGDGGCFDYYDCSNTLQNICVDNSATVYICAIGTPTQSSGIGVNASNQGPCSTTTTTTTTEAPAYTNILMSNSSLDITVTDVVVNGDSITSTSFPLYTGNGGFGTTPHIGIYTMAVYYTSAITGQNINISDSINAIQCQSAGGFGGSILYFPNVTFDGVNAVTLNIQDGACL